jgi:hypothetical protein
VRFHFFTQRANHVPSQRATYVSSLHSKPAVAPGEKWKDFWVCHSQIILQDAGIGIESSDNIVPLKGHKGPHPELYHRRVYERLLRLQVGKGEMPCIMP